MLSAGLVTEVLVPSQVDTAAAATMQRHIWSLIRRHAQQASTGAVGTAGKSERKQTQANTSKAET